MSPRVLIRPFLVVLLLLVAVLAPAWPAAASVEAPICVGVGGQTIVCIL